jgi:hypothetical protein
MKVNYGDSQDELLFYRCINYFFYYFNNNCGTNMSRKTNTALIALLGTILMGLATWTLVTLIELQLIVTMIQTDLMSIDKQFGRVYNFIDSVRGN